MSKKKRKPRNPVRVDGGWVNDYGVFFTDEQKKALELSVRRSNRRRKKEQEEWANLPHVAGGVKMSKDGVQLKTMNKENEFILSHQRGTLRNFKSMAEYDKYMRKQEAIQSGAYEEEKIRLYKRNYMNALMDTYGDEAKDIVMKIRMMPPMEYIKLVQTDEIMELRFLPSDEYVQGRLNEIRGVMQRFGMNIKLKEDWPEEELE